jgi:hypothetical protein
MANSRRGPGRGGFGAGRADLRGTLGSLVRSTLAQAGVVRDVLERGAREGRARLEGVQLDRRHTDALATLGGAVLDLIRSGELADLEDVPAIAEAVAVLEDIEAQRSDRDRSGPARWRRDRDDERDGPELRAAIERDLAPRRPRADDDGTVASGARPRAPISRPAAPAAPAAREPRVWRPSSPPDEITRDLRGSRDAAEPGAGFREPARPPRAGGIQFDRPGDGPGADDDLAEYMHPDDIPPR